MLERMHSLAALSMQLCGPEALPSCAQDEALLQPARDRLCGGPEHRLADQAQRVALRGHGDTRANHPWRDPERIGDHLRRSPLER
jgi:hypothetical protein